MQDYLTKKKMEKERAREWVSVEPPIKEVGHEEVAEPEQEEEQELPGLTPEHSMTRSETSNGFQRVASSPRSDSNPLNRVGSSPRLTGSPSNCSALTTFVAPPATPGLRFVSATVKSVVSVGEGDRVSVDLCNLLNPGEAMLVGSFSKGMFLVHSEVQANNTSRKSFRVNAVSNNLHS